MTWMLTRRERIQIELRERQIDDWLGPATRLLDLQIGARERLEAEADAPTCRRCGCIDQDCSECVERTGTACFWVETDLCSACATPAALQAAAAVGRRAAEIARAYNIPPALPGAPLMPAPVWPPAWNDGALRHLARTTPYSFFALVQLRNNTACAPAMPAPRAKPSDVTTLALAEHLPLHIAFHRVNSRPDPEPAR